MARPSALSPAARQRRPISTALCSHDDAIVTRTDRDQQRPQTTADDRRRPGTTTRRWRRNAHLDRMRLLSTPAQVPRLGHARHEEHAQSMRATTIRIRRCPAATRPWVSSSAYPTSTGTSPTYHIRLRRGLSIGFYATTAGRNVGAKNICFCDQSTPATMLGHITRSMWAPKLCASATNAREPRRSVT